jgi:hypothetical protein
MMDWEVDISEDGEWKRIPRVIHSITELLGVVKTLLDLKPECDLRIRRIPVENGK